MQARGVWLLGKLVVMTSVNFLVFLYLFFTLSSTKQSFLVSSFEPTPITLTDIIGVAYASAAAWLLVELLVNSRNSCRSEVDIGQGQRYTAGSVKGARSRSERKDKHGIWKYADYWFIRPLDACRRLCDRRSPVRTLEDCSASSLVSTPLSH